MEKLSELSRALCELENRLSAIEQRQAQREALRTAQAASSSPAKHVIPHQAAFDDEHDGHRMVSVHFPSADLEKHGNKNNQRQLEEMHREADWRPDFASTPIKPSRPQQREPGSSHPSRPLSSSQTHDMPTAAPSSLEHSLTKRPQSPPKRRGTLVMIKGKDAVRAVVVPCAAASFNPGDVFMFDSGSQLFIWRGATSNQKERAKAMALATRIKSDEPWRTIAKVLAVDQSKELSQNEKNFWSHLGLSRSDISTETDVQTDEDFERECQRRFQLRCADAQGNLSTIASGDAMKSDLLNDQGVFVVDAGPLEVYVWVGSHAPSGLLSATVMLLGSVPHQVVREGSEPVLLKDKFRSWRR